MNQPINRIYTLLLFALIVIIIAPLQAAGPLYVTGSDSNSPGQPFRWKTNPIPYKTDLGNLGNQTNAQANALVADATQVWQDVATADLGMQRVGSLSYDVTAANILTFYNAIVGCSDASQPTLSMLYDVDGSLITALGQDKNSVLGLSGPLCIDTTTGEYLRGWTILNGSFIDGKPQSSTHNTVTLAEFKGAFVHEFGHVLGLDHSQINLNCYTGTSCTTEDLAGIPVMFPILLDNATSTLKRDDISAISTIYPNSSFASTTGRIQGRVMFSDGLTPAQGFNVIARKVGDSRRTAISSVSGYLFTGDTGNIYAPYYASDTANFYGSQDPDFIGYYDIAGLPPGEYTLEVEAINDSGDNPFIDSSSVGTMGAYFNFQFKMPGTCALQYLKYPSSTTDSCSDYTTIQVSAGTTVNANTDIILLGTPPRYDAWEDGD
jgi:hypothetical protein